MAVRIIVDSTADYSMAEIEKRQITCIPMTIAFGEEQYTDGVDLSKNEFFEKLIGEDVFPKTSQPSPAVFAECFEKAKEAGDSAVAILISGALSGTLQSAELAKDMVEYDDIFIIDSKSATLGIRMLADRAVRMRDQGAGAEAIAAELEELKPRIRIYAGLDTLEYLYKGGRLSKAEAAIGKLAGIKPMIAVKEGEVVLQGKQRGVKQICKQLAKILEEETPDPNYPVYFIYAYDKKNCITFIQSLQKKGMEFGEVKTRGIGPTIGAHIGPGAFGIVYIK